jgi:hypothetical protein
MKSFTSIKIYQYTKIAIIIVLFLALLLQPTTYHLLPIPPAFAAQPHSTNFTIQSYSFGAGGIASASSTNYSLNGIAGEVEYGRPFSTNFKVGSGLTYLMQANVPTAPTFTNPSSNYDRLKVVVNESGNPSNTTYALQISTDSSFATNVYYVKSDKTIGATLTLSDFLPYSSGGTNWGGASGSYITGLAQGTTY